MFTELLKDLFTVFGVTPDKELTDYSGTVFGMYDLGETLQRSKGSVTGRMERVCDLTL